MPTVAKADIVPPPGTRFVDAFVIDVNGIPRGKRLPAADFVASGGRVAFSASALVLDAQGHNQGPLGIGTEDGDPDATGETVPGSIAPVPWAGPQIAQALLTMRTEGTPIWFDPRQILADIVVRCRADGLHPVVACELEFYLVERDIERGLERDANAAPRPPARPGAGPAASAGHLCLQDLQANAPLLHALHEALTAQGIAAGTLVSEYGPGQFEVNLTHGPDPLRAADEAALLRRATHGVAASQGLRASFMAKPYAQKSGSGLHVHVSLVDAAGRNRFGAERGQALLEHAVAGMQALHAESMAIFAPSFSAYRRYKPGAFVAAAGAWAENSRAAAFRIPPGGPASRRIEHRIACADASPHLTMAAILAALHHGITRQLTPTQTGPGGVPNNIFSALDALERSTALAAYLPPRFPALFAALKRAETAALLENIALAEWDYYL
jgi:glutamine synthetase